MKFFHLFFRDKRNGLHLYDLVYQFYTVLSNIFIVKNVFCVCFNQNKIITLFYKAFKQLILKVSVHPKNITCNDNKLAGHVVLDLYKSFISVMRMNSRAIDYQVNKPIELWSSDPNNLAEAVRSNDRLDGIAVTMPLPQREVNAGVHYCNSPFRPVTGSEG